MKKLTYILKNHITDRIIAVTSLVAIMLCVSSVAQANYFMYGTQDNCSAGWGSAVATESSSKYSITISATTGHNYYVGYTGANASCDDLTSGDVTVDKSGCSVCSAGAPQEKGTKKYAYFSVSSNSNVTVEYDPSNNKYTITSGSAPVESSYYACGSKAEVFGTAWCTDGSCPTNNALTLSGGYYTKTYRKIENTVEFKLHNSTAYIANCYDGGSPTNLNGITSYNETSPDKNMQLTGVKNSSGANKETSFDMTIKYDASTNKTYLITTPYIFFKGPIFNKGNWNDNYSASCWEWTDISKVGDNWVFTYDWTINSTGLGTKLFTICTTTNENNGYKLANSETLDLVGVERAPDGSYWNYEPTISISDGDNLRLRVTRRGPEDYKVELINLDVSTPAVRIGKKLTEVTAEGGTQGDVRVSAYIAATGCANVNKVKIFYANNSSFRNGEGYKSASVEKTLESAVTENNQCAEDLYLTAAQVSSVVGKGETLYVRVKAINTNDVSSAYSDVAKLTYQYDKFIVANQTIADATACDGKHEFKWTGEGGMFNPVPDGYTVKYNDASGSDASSEFTIVGDKMVWSDLSKYDDDASSEPHTYYFTASKTGYASAAATATFTLTATALDDVTVTILENGNPVTEVVSADPWVEKTFTATRSDGNTGIIWENPENTSLKVSNNGATVVFKGEKPSTSPYIIKARAANESCGRSQKTEAGIMVDAIIETCSN